MTKLFQYVNYIDYDELINKPLINHVVVEGDKTLADYGIQPAGNYAHLNSSGKVPFEELDDSILGNLQYQGTWDAEHNNPNLPLVPAKKGQYWIVSHGGERFELEFETGDWIIAGDSVWQKIDNTDTIISVNGKRGVVVLNAADIPYGASNVKEALDSKQHALTAGKNIKIENNVISAEFTEAILDYNLLYHHPSINGVELINNKTLEDLDIQKTIYAGQNVYLTKSDAQKMDDTINVYTATESRNGVSEIATQQETNTGTDDFRYITPKKLKPIRDALEQAIAAEETRAKGVEGDLSNLTTDTQSNLVSAINEVDSHADTNATNIGTLSSLTTDAKNNLVAAINEVDSHSDSTASDLADEITRATGVEGTLSNLTTDAQTNLVSAINEVDSHTDTNTSNIGTLSSLTTTDKTNLVAAINEVDSDLADEITRATGVEGTLSSLTTDAQTNLVSAINEVDSHADTNTTNLSNHTGNTSNPHSVTKAQVGLGNVDNTADIDKPVSTAQQTALDGKVSDVKVNGTSVVTNMIASVTVPTKTSDITNDSDFTTNALLNAGLAGKIDKFESLPQASNEYFGKIVQYVGTTDSNYTNGYFYKCIEDGYLPDTVTFTPKEGVSTIVAVTPEDFVAFITPWCEGRPFTPSDVTHGGIGIYSSSQYAMTIETDDEQFAHGVFTIAELNEAGFTFTPPYGSQQGSTYVCSIGQKDYAWEQINVQPETDISGKADKATTLAGYGITDAYTKTEVDAKVSSVYRVRGSVADYAHLPSSDQVVGDVWNILDSGSNYVWDGTNWDKLSETVDLTPYLTKIDAQSTYETITNVSSHTSNTSNPHSVTKAQVGLGNVDNTSDLNKPISTATQTALDGKVSDVKVNGTSVVTNKVASISVPVQSVNGDTGAVIVQAIKNQNTSKGMTKIWEGNQSQYDAIASKDSTTAYLIEGTDSIYTDLEAEISNKQDKLIAGANITFSGNVVSAIVPTKTSDLTNDSNFITNNDITGKADKSYVDTELAKKQNTLTFDNTPTASSNNPVKSSGIKSALDLKQDKVTGSSGEVLYHNGTNVFTQSLLNEGFVCMNATDVATCENNSPSFADVFATWKKFSHLNGENDAKPSEMSAWTYDSVNDTIVQPQNTTSYVGFISPKSYSSYDITVRCYSTGSDDDSMGLVAAFATDGNGREHTLSFIRTPGGTGTSAKWVCILDYTAFNLTATSYGQTIIVNKSSTTPTPSSTANWNTETIGVGTVINMTRSGNVITAACSQFNSTTVDENTRITIDLDTLSQTYPTLALFKGSSPWGYSNCSQANSMYENIAVTDPDGYIFDVTNNQVLQYIASTRTWNVVSGVTPIEVIGAGRFSYNSTTGKLFYCTGTTILQIATNN